MQPETRTVTPNRPNWRQVVTFLTLTFGLTYLFDLVLYLTIGYGESAGSLLLVQFQMLISAAVAIVLLLADRKEWTTPVEVTALGIVTE